MTKLCVRCKKIKDIEQFNNNKRCKDGKYYYCKPCKSEISKSEARRHRKDYLRRSHKFRSTPKGKATVKRVYDNLKINRPEVYRARVILNKTIRTGRLKRLPCEVCLEPNGHAHHEDYSKPLDVIWLCRRHHQDLHNSRRQVV